MKMIVVMDMTTGKIEEGAAPEFGAFQDEVLNAGWLQPALALGLQPAVHRDPAPAEAEAESFLNNVYRSQGGQE